ncbi:MAG: glutathione peroxidase [Bacteroidales bacterium]|nr:glutathione peroxidase [Bacteroidales bacterium]
MLLGLLGCNTNKRPAKSSSKIPFYELHTVSLTGDTIRFEQFRGKKVLLVNTASKCGFTPQYAELEELHKNFGDKLQIIGFPANNFMNQEPGSSEDIADFCERNYGVSFLMSDKVSVKGEDMHPVYQWLTEKDLNGWNTKSPTWNFQKYLVDENGELEAVFAPSVKPLDKKIVSQL